MSGKVILMVNLKSKKLGGKILAVKIIILLNNFL